MRIFDKQQLAPACQWLATGNLLAYPTEAVWGLGCDPFNEHAVQQILAIKNRPLEKGMIVIAPSLAHIRPFFSILSQKNQQRILQSWDNQNSHQQATTWLFPLPENLPIKIPDWVTGRRDTLAIRVIAHPTVARLCQKITSPHNPYGFLVSTSCNPSGEPPATNLEEAQAYFAGFSQVGYFDDLTLNYSQPSQINHAITGEGMRA